MKGGGGGARSKKALFPLAKICHTYPTMMKLGTVIPLKKIQKMYELLNSVPTSAFFRFHFGT